MENEPKEVQSKYPPPPECEQFANRVETWQWTTSEPIITYELAKGNLKSTEQSDCRVVFLLIRIIHFQRYSVL